jgi:cell wall-associated NlpC family hydrolase
MPEPINGIQSGQVLSSNIDKNIAKQAKFNKELDITLQKANAILKAFGMPQMGGGGGGSGNNIGSTGTYSASAGGGSSVANFGSFLAKAGTVALGVASGAAQALPGLQEVLGTQLLTSQARFSGLANPIAASQAAMRGGQATSPTDALQAISMGTAGGLMPAMPGYGGVLNGVSQLSNITGSQSTAMQAAVALNSAKSVNTLRMFGINVRNASGGMNDPAAIFKQIYNFASQGGKLSKQDVAIGIQPGNGLANFLDTAAGGDQTLRAALQTAAIQFSGGGDLSRTSTNASGLTTVAQGATSDLNAAKLGTEAAAAPAMSNGYIEGARLLSKFNSELTNTLNTSKLANDAVKQLAKAETIAADNIGKAGLSVLAVLGASGALGGVAGIAAKGAKRLISGVAGRFLGIGAAEAAGAEAGAFAGPIGIGVGLLGGFIAEKVISGLNRSSSGNGGGATVSSSPQNSAGSSFAGSAAIMVANSQLGTPYSWGGGSNSGPTKGEGSGTNTRGFDCSSFVKFVMAKMGVVLPRTSQAQQQCGIQIDPKDAQPGDLLFFGRPADHVGIYMGNNLMIEAPHTGDVVKRTGVDLKSVTSCSRVLDGKTGTASLKNLLHIAGGYKGDGGFVGGFPGMQMSINELRGNTPQDAMSGGTSSSSGLGLGESSSMYHSASSTAMNLGSKYAFINPKTGTLDTSNSAGGTVVNYGGVTVEVKVPNGAQINAQELSKAIKNELKSLPISVKVATK